jgi:hypothetical protein
MHLCASTRPRVRVPTCTHTHTHRQKLILIYFPRQRWFAKAPRCYVIHYKFLQNTCIFITHTLKWSLKFGPVRSPRHFHNRSANNCRLLKNSPIFTLYNLLVQQMNYLSNFFILSIVLIYVLQTLGFWMCNFCWIICLLEDAMKWEWISKKLG